MASYASFALRRGVKPPAHPSVPAVSPFAAQRQQHAERPAARLLPPRPDSIPVESGAHAHAPGNLQIGAARGPLEAEANAVATGTLATHRETDARPSATAVAAQPVQAPQAVHDALNSAGQPLDSATRAFMEPRLGKDLGGVRIHTGPHAAESTRSVEAHAYTVGQDIFFGSGNYRPHTSEGRRLLAHELGHAVQQSGGGPGLTSAAPAVQRDPVSKTATQGTTTDTDTKKPKTKQVTVPVPPSALQQLPIQPAAGAPAGTPAPAQAQPQQQTPAPAAPAPLAPKAPPIPSFSPTPQGATPAAPAAAPKAPDRVSFHDFGVLSIGARIGFPDLSKDTKPGDPPSALQESIKKGEILNFMFTHQPPSEYSVDPAKLVGALWGIFSTQIDPGLAAKIAAGMASKPTGSGPTYQLDATILLNLSGPKTGGGAGATLTVNF